jgi:hypothetical protein
VRGWTDGHAGPFAIGATFDAVATVPVEDDPQDIKAIFYYYLFITCPGSCAGTLLSAAAAST